MVKNTVAYASLAAAVVVASAVSCARGGSSGSTYTGGGGNGGLFGDDGGGGGTGTPPGGDDGGGITIPPPMRTMGATQPCSIMTQACTSMCTDFPAKQLTDQAPQDGSGPVPADAATHFQAAASTSGGPCIVEPQDGTLIPQNWLRPRFRFVPAPGQNLFQIRLHADSEVNDYVLYTTSKVWTMPRTDWEKLRASIWGQDITVTVTGVNTSSSGGAPTSSSAKFRIAPAGAGGAMIYWAAVGDKNGMSWLEGFNVGDETVATVLTPPDVQLQISRDQGGNLQTDNGMQTPGSVECIGCHAAIPDGVDGGLGTSVAFVDF